MEHEAIGEQIALECSLERLNDAASSFGFSVKHMPGRGRCCIATRHIRSGETLALDPPLLYWEDEPMQNSVVANSLYNACGGRVHANVVNLFSAYIDASPEIQERVDDFAVAGSPQEARFIADKTAVWQEICKQIWSGCSEYHDQLKSTSNMVALLTKSHINAHGFNGGHAMLEVASKSNHACSPNATYVPIILDGRKFMRLLAIKNIAPEEEIFTTYIAGLDMLNSTRNRRALLVSQKAFVCRCSRCIAPDLQSRLPCPACKTGTMIWHDTVEHPWHCQQCGRRFWDGQVNMREKQLQGLLSNLDSQMNRGGFPPLSIMAFLMRDVEEDLGRHHYLQIQAWSLMEELFAYRSVAGLADDATERPVRLANAWKYVRFLMLEFWDTTPVVATNLSVLRLQTLITHGADSQSGQKRLPPPGVPLHELKKVLKRASQFLTTFFGEQDIDAQSFRQALQDYNCCARESCDNTLTETCVACPKCSLLYCNRKCLNADKSLHEAYCTLAQKVGVLVNDPRELIAAI
ncbi:hypothetical protein BCR37DRAFT_375764 [Protomyces lactucae-debilis]|uniref:SET domain-containing protein n=1 Tax=Protomyces lactucae-debilis TaxID=2754530 RepID=A0A1Y2FX26_PROLT|nr:uncharacterized protein BCR37DRAFT_375764 [Protomyces lactucae-debilis]ORY87854.1 hypothetical protein BCR37DRAFT_375764 [Protomyces lactucae-debilis]